MMGGSIWMPVVYAMQMPTPLDGRCSWIPSIYQPQLAQSTFHDGQILITVGPRGELPGRCEDWDEVCCGRLKKIAIRHGKAINSIQMAYERHSTSLFYSHRRGGEGDVFDTITLKPWETFTEISGRYGAVDDSGEIVVRSLRFDTNVATYGPFGREEGTLFSFTFKTPALSFGGFHGRSGNGYLRALGVYVATEARKHFGPEPDRFVTSAAWKSPDKWGNTNQPRVYYS